MLPEALLCLLNAAIIYAQATRQQLALNTVFSFNSPSPPLFTIPNTDEATVSIALCAASPLRFFVSNSSTADNPGSSLGENVFEIQLNDGMGSWVGSFRKGGVLGVEGGGSASFEVGLSDGPPLHERLPSLPLLGDTTSNQAILFSPPFANASFDEPKYPNYTLPAANASLPDPPDTTRFNFTLFLSPTLSSSLPNLPKTGCALRAQRSEGSTEREAPWLRDEKGWRQQWVMAGLTPSTNYTAYIVQEGTRISGPIMFATKSASFACPLVASLPYCPGVAYSVPLPPPASPAQIYDASTIPDDISTPIISGLANFTASLLTFACGNDYYSPLVSCADCQREYRKWLCTISFPRCGEASPSEPGAFTRTPAAPSETGIGAQPTEGGPQQVFSALLPQSSTTPQRNPTFPQAARDWTMLLPCLETCHAVDRACPYFLGFKCPVRRFNAAATYGVGYIDTGDHDGKQGAGVVGVAQDEWGNVWCNSG